MGSDRARRRRAVGAAAGAERRSGRGSSPRPTSCGPTSTRPSSRRCSPATSIGCVSGFLVAILADRSPFLRRGLLPVGNLVSALPIIGMAPIMVMWFGFDWQSKAAVVVIMTFFPMLVNTVAGLAAADAMQRDLMRTYAADYWQTLVKLRLPAALPFIFNALKINSTLALIAAIVAEFFGTPTSAWDSASPRRSAAWPIDMVWAEIAVAALGRLRVLWRHGAHRARRDVLASVLPHLTADGNSTLDWEGSDNEKTSDNAIAGSRPGPRLCLGLRRRRGDAAAQVGDAGPVCRLLRRQGQGLLRRGRPRRHHQAGRPGHQPAAGPGRRRRRCRRRLDAVGARHPREGRADWSTSPSRSRNPAWS